MITTRWTYPIKRATLSFIIARLINCSRVSATMEKLAMIILSTTTKISLVSGVFVRLGKLIRSPRKATWEISCGWYDVIVDIRRTQHHPFHLVLRDWRPTYDLHQLRQHSKRIPDTETGHDNAPLQSPPIRRMVGAFMAWGLLSYHSLLQYSGSKRLHTTIQTTVSDFSELSTHPLKPLLSLLMMTPPI